MTVQRHHLDIMIYMLYWIRFPIIKVKWRSSKSARHRCLFDISWEWRLSSSTQCLAHSIRGSIPGSLPFWGNWVPVCILPRPILVSMGTRLMGHLSIATSHTSWPLCTLLAVSFSMHTSCFQLQIPYQPKQAFKFLVPLVETLMPRGA